MKTLYHLTATGNRKSILESGLRTRNHECRLSGISYTGKLFLFSDLNDPPFFMVGGMNLMDIWEVKVPEGACLEKDPFAESDGHATSLMCGVPVPAKNLRLLKTLWHPIEVGPDEPVLEWQVERELEG